MRKVRQFPGDPWNRVQQDMDGLVDVARQVIEGQGAPKEKPLTDSEAHELAAHLLRPENLDAELKAFMYGCTPATVKKLVGSSCSTSGALGRTMWSRWPKYSRKSWRRVVCVILWLFLLIVF